MSNLKRFKDLPIPRLECKLWAGDSKETSVFVRVITGKEQLEILTEMERFFKANEDVDTKRSRDYYYNLLTAYYSTVDENNNHLGTLEEFEKFVDAESIERINGTFNKILVAKAPSITFLSEEDVELFFDYLKTVDSASWDGLVAFHVKNVVDYLNACNWKETKELMNGN